MEYFSGWDEPDDIGYRKREYKAEWSLWQFCEDMWHGRSRWYDAHSGAITDAGRAATYLPRDPGEPASQYRVRVSRSYMSMIFREAIVSTAGFLETRAEGDLPPTVEAARDDCDGRGNTFSAFFRNADIKALMKERCVVLVDFPRGTPRDALEERGRRPRLVLYDVEDVINWKLRDGGGGLPFEWIVFRERASVPKGKFGEEVETRYRLVGEGWYQVWVDGGREGGKVMAESGTFSLPAVPAVVYSVNLDDPHPMSGAPPLLDVAEKQLQLYQKESNRDTIVHKLSPFLTVRKLNPRALDDDPDAPLAIGPNTVLWDCDATFVSPGPGALEPLREDIRDLREQVELRTLGFQSGTYPNVTATEIERRTAGSQASLETMAAAKLSSLNRIFEVWRRWTGEAEPARMGVNERILREGIDRARAELYAKLRADNRIGDRTYLRLLKEGKWLPEDTDVDAVLEEAAQDRTLSPGEIATLDLLLRYQVISPDELASAVREGTDWREAIDLTRREEDRGLMDG